MKNQILNLDNPTELSGFYIVYRGSTLNEKEGIYGISHLMEHLMCKNFDHLMDEFDQHGISWNAYTSNDNIVFHFTGLEEKLDMYRDKLLDLMKEFKATEKEFENEKNIVIEEYKDSFNDQISYHYHNLQRKMFGLYNPIGKLQDLQKLTYQDCLDYYEKQFKYPSFVINVSKDKKYKRDIQFANDSNKYYNPIEYLKKDDFIYQPSNEFKDKSSIIYTSDVIRDDFGMFKFLGNMLGHGLNSPLYKELREKRGLVYFIITMMNKLSDSSGIMDIVSLTSNDNIEEYMETLNEILRTPEKYLTQKRFDIIKDFYYSLYKKKAINRYSNVESYLEPNNWSVEFILDVVNMDDLMVLYNKYILPDKLHKSIDKEEFKNN